MTGVTVSDIIRASHVKPWKVSSNHERLNQYNGLPLVATLDALFDRGLITFDDSGRMMISRILKAEECKCLSLNGLRLLERPHDRTAEFLKFHREHVFNVR